MPQSAKTVSDLTTFRDYGVTNQGSSWRNDVKNKCLSLGLVWILTGIYYQCADMYHITRPTGCRHVSHHKANRLHGMIQPASKHITCHGATSTVCMTAVQQCSNLHW